MVDIFNPLKEAPIGIAFYTLNKDSNRSTVIIDGTVKTIIRNPISGKMFIIEDESSIKTNEPNI